ncbi:MAG: molybdopterin-dependent oxidoreductase [Candidatus Asgardarchaeia archaeon]
MEIFATCPRDCYDTCSLIVKVENGKIKRVRGNPKHPITAGKLCSKGYILLDYVYSKERILSPMERVGKKGEGKFRKVSWDYALKLISKKIREVIENYGPEYILHYEYSGNMGLLSFYFPQRFFNYLGASRIKYTICDAAGEEAISLHYGLRYGRDPLEILKSRLIVYWGMNPSYSNLHGFILAKQAVKNGAKLYVIDPIKTNTTKIGTHINVRPGTDGVLALSIANYIIENDLYDNEFIEKYTEGFEEFKRYVSKYDLDYASKVTGIDVKDIESFAEDYSKLKPSLIHMGYGIQRQAYGGEIVRAICLLPALVGIHRGFIFCNNVRKIDYGYLTASHLAKGREIKEYNMIKLGEVLLNGKVKFLFVYNSNPAATLPNQNAVLEGLKREDIFTVVHDLFITDTALYADLLLPATSFFENEDIHVSYWHNYLSINKPAIKPLGECLSNSELFRRLAREMGLKLHELYESDEEIIKKVVSMDGLIEGSIEDLEEKGFVKLKTFPIDEYQTESGKIEFFSKKAIKLGLSPFPEPNVERGNFPLRLLTISHPSLINSQYHNIIKFEPVIYMNGDDARERGIKNGDYAKVYNEVGELIIKVKISEKIPKGVVASFRTPWHRVFSMKNNVNVLIRDDVQRIAGGSTFNSTYVEVKKVKLSS